MRVVILVPRRAGIEDRDRLWTFAHHHWSQLFPTWEIVEGFHDQGPFNRSAAINAAARTAGDWDVAVIIDADVLADRDPVIAAVELAAATGRMVLGYHERISLNPHGTTKVMAGFTGGWKGPSMVAREHLDSCSSCVVVRRDLFDAAGGFDEAFVGWGWEDVCARITFETLSGQPMVKIAGSLFHLHHRTSHENNQRAPTLTANKERADRYKAAHWDVDAIRALRGETVPFVPTLLDDPLIPRILHRTVPATDTEVSDAYWDHWQQLLPGWKLLTHRDPLEPSEWPETSSMWRHCQNGAQLAGLIRLEALWTFGGIYVDSDVEPLRSLEPLLACSGFAAWEDAKVVPDAVMGAEPNHPAVRIMLDRALKLVENGADAWRSGPGVTTAVLPGRGDWMLFPPGAFYPYHYNDKGRARDDHFTNQPWCYAIHRWAASWVPK